MSDNSSGNEAAGQARAVLAYDLGTGGVKAALVTEDGALRDSEFVAYPTHYPEPGRHEQNPQDWWDAIASASRAILERSGDGVALQAISLSGQSLALVPVDASLSPLTNRAPIWSDSRASEIAEEYFSRVDPREWYLRTGNGFPAELYTIFEYSWYAAHEPAAVADARWLLGSKDWINAKLTGEVATDPSYASGLGAYDLAIHDYADELAEAAGIDPALLPPIVASTAIVGTVLPEAAAALGVPAGLPVVAGGVDNSCMALGAGLDADGTMYLSLGSSNWLTVATPSPVLDNTHRPYVFDHVIDGLYVSAFSTFAGGSSLNWLSELLKTPLPELLEAAASEPVGSRGLVCVPTLAGGTVAEGGSDVRGVFLGLDLGHDAGALTRAVVEGVALSLAGTAELLASHVEVPASILAVGGGARSDLLLQTLADVLDRSVVRVSGDQSSAALGAAGLGFLGTGVWSDLSGLATERAATATFTPNPANQAVLRESRATFDAAAAAARAAAPLTRAVLRAGVQAS